MHIACPHCQNSIEVEGISTAKDIVCEACGSTFRLESASTTAWSPPNGNRKLGKFELLDQVGFGAFGTVFKARDPELDRIVAIKVPRSGNLATGEDLHRFLREARSVARLRHPSIVPVYEVGQADSLPYLVSEFVQGMTLADLMTARRLPPQRTATLLAEVADALQYAHDQGVIHRDVKPSNILLDNDNHPHLMDFGLAKRDAGEVSMTLEGQVLGTPAYMSPEQASGEAHHVDGRSDIYSLGVILYQLLTGELPFKGNQRALLHQVQHEDPPPPRRLAKDIPADLETICQKAMARERERRYATAKALAEDLRRFLNGEPILARPPRAWTRGLRWIKRNRATLVSVAAGLAVGVLIFVVAYLARLHLPIAPSSEPISQVNAEPPEPAPKKEGPEEGVVEKAAAPLPADLELIRRDGAVFMTVRVADLAGQEGIKRLVQALEKFPSLWNALAWEDEFEKAFGARPPQSERLTIFVPSSKKAPESSGPASNPDRPPAPPGSFSSRAIFVCTTTEPYDRNKLLAWMGTNPQEKTYQGKTYYLAAKPKTQVLHFLTDRLVVLSGSEEALQAFLVQSPGEVQWGRLHSSLALAAQRYQCAFGLNFQDPTSRMATSIFLQTFLQSLGSPTVSDLKPKLGAFADVQTAVLLLGLRSGALSGDKVQLRLRLAYKDAERARLAVNEVRDLVTRIEAPLRQMMQRIVSNPRTFEQMGAGVRVQADAMKKLFGVYEQFLLALRDVEINAERNVVDIRFPDLAIDLSGFATAIGGITMAGLAAARGGNLTQLGMALEDYVAEHHRLPPAAITGPDGEPLLSWRVALLPYLGEKELYTQFNLKERWDSDHNKKLLERMPAVFAREGTKKKTSSTPLRVYTGPGTPFEGREGLPLSDITDGLPSTLLIAQTSVEVPWTKPEELPYDPKQPLSIPVERGLFADGSERLLVANLDPQTRQGIITRNGGEKIDLAKLPVVQSGGFLNDAAWAIVRPAQNSADRYHWGLRLAEKATRLNPKNGDMVNTLGVAQYRAGRYPDALATLTRSQQMNAGLGNASLVADLAFLALTEERLGHHAQAVTYLGRLRDELKKPAHARNTEGQDFLREAEALIEGGVNKKQ